MFSQLIFLHITKYSLAFKYFGFERTRWRLPRNSSCALNVTSTCLLYKNLVSYFIQRCSKNKLKQDKHHIFSKNTLYVCLFMVFNATFNNISTISWRSVLLVEETTIPGESHRPVVSHWQTWSYNVVSSTPRHERGSQAQL